MGSLFHQYISCVVTPSTKIALEVKGSVASADFSLEIFFRESKDMLKGFKIKQNSSRPCNKESKVVSKSSDSF